MAIFKGQTVKNRKDVESVVSFESSKIFGDQSSQFKMLSEVVALLCAYRGLITFSRVGIQTVTDSISADAYISNLYTTLWTQRNSLLAEAQQCIADNNLQ